MRGAPGTGRALPPRAAAWAAAALWAASPGAGAPAQEEALPPGVLLLADEAVHDRDADTVTAAGEVELSRGGRILRADRVTYSAAADRIAAEGNVALIEPSGEVMFADSADLAGDLKSGEARAVGMLFTDRSRLAAAGGRRTADGASELAKAVYSPCEPCENDPGSAPLWRMKAERVVHDPQDRTIDYYDATLDAFGVSIFYLPYFSQADPTVRRKTGFLAPSIGQNSTFGLTWTQPFFLVLSPHDDFTFVPVYLSRGMPILAGQYRREMRAGALRFEGSVTRERLLPPADERAGRVRGHIHLKGDFSVGTHWRYGFGIEHASDATYIRRYGLGGDPDPDADRGGLDPIVQRRGSTDVFAFAAGRPFLTRNVYLRGAESSREITVDAWAFQSLDPNADTALSPIVAPVADFRYRSDPGQASSVWTLDANARLLFRRAGADSARVSATAGWELPFSTPLGDRYRLRASLRADGYRISASAEPPNPAPPDPLDAPGPADAGFVGRALPQLALGWRWPWARSGKSWNFVVEPLAKAIAAPRARNPETIPNDDSLAFEFDEINLFGDSRYPGLDRMEGGVRAGYALRVSAFAETGAGSELLVGQAWRASGGGALETGAGLAKGFSDIVGRLAVRPDPFIEAATRFRIDRNEFTVRRGSLTVAAGPPWLRGSVTYTTLSPRRPTSAAPSDAKQADVSAALRLGRFWSVLARHSHDLAGEAGALSSGLGLSYRDECLFASLDLNRRYSGQRDIEDTTEVYFQIKLRNFD